MRLVLFLVLSLTVALQAQGTEITPVTSSEINQFSPEWCAPNQIIAQNIRFVCVGTANFGGVGSTRAVVIERADQTRDLFVEKDFSSIDMLNLEFEVIGPVASSKPRDKFAPKYSGAVKLSVDADGEIETVSGVIRFTEQFHAVRP